MLEPFTENVWTAASPLRFLGVELGTRMVVIRLASGELVLYSPIAIDDALAAEIDALGAVRHVIAPSLYHHLFAGHAKKRYSDAVLHGSAKLAKKRSDLRFDRTLPETAFGDELVAIPIDGCMLGETVFYHPASKTLVASDLIENFHGSDHGPTRLYLRLNGIWQKPGVSSLIKMLYRDKKAARKSVDRVLDLPFERISIAHGEPLARDARDVLRDGYRWLR